MQAELLIHVAKRVKAIYLVFITTANCRFNKEVGQ